MARTQGSHSDITGPRIQKVALQLFARHGYAAVSMRQIAKEVGVQVGALYNYLPDKQSLLFSLMNKHMQDVLAAWKEQKATLDPCRPDGLLEEFARFHIRFHMARPDAVFIAYMELRNLSPENFAKIEALRKSYEGELQSILDAGVAQRIFTLRDSKITTLAVIAMLNGVITWYRSGGRLSLEEVEATYWDMVRKAVTG